MSKKVKAVIVTVFVALTLSACGADGTKPDETTASQESTGQTITEMPSEETLVSAEETEPDEQTQNSTVTWYMDSEGVKNDVLGTVIKKDNPAVVKVGLSEVVVSKQSGISELFWCEYHDGDLDSYLAENNWMNAYTPEKGEFCGTEYVYWEYMPGTLQVIFGGDGVVLWFYLDVDDLEENQSMDDFLNDMELINKEDQFGMDCLAYMTGEGLFCPALGLSVTGEVQRMMVDCDMYGGSMNLEEADILYRVFLSRDTFASSAQEAADTFVEDAVSRYADGSYGSTVAAINGIQEVNLGYCSYVGRGYTKTDEWSSSEEWEFYSDDTTWLVSMNYYTGAGQNISYEDYLAVIEPYAH